MKEICNKILVVDDEPKIVDAIKAYLENSGYLVFTAFDGVEALNKFEKVDLNPYNLVEITNQNFIDKKFVDHSSFELLYLKGPKHT